MNLPIETEARHAAHTCWKQKHSKEACVWNVLPPDNIVPLDIKLTFWWKKTQTTCQVRIITQQQVGDCWKRCLTCVRPSNSKSFSIFSRRCSFVPCLEARRVMLLLQNDFREAALAQLWLFPHLLPFFLSSHFLRSDHRWPIVSAKYQRAQRL